MNSAALNLKQLESLRRTIQRQRNFLDNLCGRMRQRYFPSNDPLKRAAEENFAAASALLVELERLAAIAKEKSRH